MEELLFSGVIGESLTLTGTLAIIGSALALGLFISIVYMVLNKNEHYSQSFMITLIMLPAIIAMIILLVGNNVARAFSLAGAFSLIRFRSAPGDAKDIAYVFFTLSIGLACGMGYIGYATLFAIILCVTMAILTTFKFGEHKDAPFQLRITMPEDIDYNGAFDGILERYTRANRLLKVKTADFGSLFELTYEVNMKDARETKEFIDKLRCKNGNLNISLSMSNKYDGML